MPRKKHEWYIGAKLHVIARGNHRNDIFRDETDYELYLSYLNEAMEYYPNRYKVIAYVLMTNHVHIIYHICMETKKIKVSLYIGINLLIWFFVQDYGQVMFWISGAANYLWAMTLILITILIFRKYSINQDIISIRILNALIIFILGILAGWSSENGSAGMLVIA